MKTLVCTAPGRFDYVTAEMPVLQKGFSLLKIKRIGICGTDFHAYEGTQPFFEYPRILGHELSAEYVEGDAAGFAPGDAVTIVPYFNCGKCVACRNGKPNCCVQIEVCGVHRHGAMAEYLSVPSYSLLHGAGLSFDELALVEPFSIGAHAISRAGIKEHEAVLVIGAGPIGLGLMTLAGVAGAQIIAMDVNEQRLLFCKEQLGIAHTINASTENVLQMLAHITNGDMPTVVIDATGNLTAINKAFEYIAHGGKYILVGLQKGDITISHPAFHKREATLMSSRNATRQDFEHVIACMQQKQVQPSAFITHKTSFNNLKEDFVQWLAPQSGVIKAMAELE